MDTLEASADEVTQAEAYILPAFQKSLEDLLRERKDPRPQFSDDRAIFGLADKAVRDYHAATARSTTLPQLSQVQLWEIRQRLYIQHSALGPLGELLAKEGVEDIHMNGLDHAYLEYGDPRAIAPVLRVRGRTHKRCPVLRGAVGSKVRCIESHGHRHDA